MMAQRSGSVGVPLALLIGLVLPGVAGAQPVPPPPQIGEPAVEVPPPEARAGRLIRPDLLQPLDPMEGLGISGGPELTLGEVLTSVDRHHPDLLAVQQQLRSAEGELQSAHGGFDLGIAASGGIYLGYYDWGRANVQITQPTPLWGATFYGGWRMGRGGNIQDYYGNYETLGGGELRAGFMLPLWQDGPIDARRRRLWRAERGIEAAEQSVELQRLRLALTASAAYWSWAAAGRRARVAEQLLELAEQRDAAIRRRALSGVSAGLDALENRRIIVARRRAVVAARRALERSALVLSLFLRDADGAPVVVGADRVPPGIPPAPSLPEDVDESIAGALARRPDLRRFDAELEQADIDRRYAENRFAPRIDLAGEISQDLGEFANSDSNFGSQTTLEDTVGIASIRLTLPLQFRDARGQVARARAAIEVLRERRRLAADTVERDVRDAYSAMAAAAEGYQLAGELEEVARAVTFAERRRFQEGLTELLIVNMREAQQAEAQAQLIDAQASLQIAYAQWVAATAANVDEDGSE